MYHRSIAFLFFILPYPGYSSENGNSVLQFIDTGVSPDCKTYVQEINDNFTSEAFLEQISKPHLSWSFAWENDSFYPPDSSDRQYTNGMQIRWLNNPCRKKSEWVRNLVRSTLGYTSSKSEYEVASGGVFGLNMFTPELIGLNQRNKYDRPYAGYTYGGFLATISPKVTSKESSREGLGLDSVTPPLEDLGEKFQHTVELQIGVTGALAGQEFAQRWIHQDVTGSTEPQGWEFQVAPNKLALQAIYLFQNDLSNSLGLSTDKVRIVGHGGGALGTVVDYLNVGGMIVIGNSYGEFPTPPIQPTAVSQLNFRQKHRERKLYGFIGIDYRHYFYNLYLEGRNESRHEIDPITGVYDLVAGLSFEFKDWLGLARGGGCNLPNS